MRRRFSRYVTGALAGGAVMAVVAGTSAVAATPGSWQIVPTPNPNNTHGANATYNVQFYAASATSPDDAWGVGLSQGRGAFLLPMAEHWDGTSWQATTVPAPPHRQAYFQGVVDLGTSDAWAVGLSTPLSADNEDEETLIEHWDGTAWSIIPSPNPVHPRSSAGDILNAISGTADDLWAVGWVSSPNAINALVEHWNGTTWSAQVLYTPQQGEGMIINAVAVLSPDDVWAVGESPGEADNEFVHFDGHHWKFGGMPTPFGSEESQDFVTGLSATGPGDLWASGWADTNVGAKEIHPYMLHWTGSTWKLDIVPDPNPYGSALYGTLVVSPEDVWAVGHTQAADADFRTLTEHFNGTGWSVVSSPSQGYGDTLFGLASGGDGIVWALGTKAIPHHCCSRTLALETTSG